LGFLLSDELKKCEQKVQHQTGWAHYELEAPWGSLPKSLQIEIDRVGSI
jgi:hypothetical protein